MSILEVPRHTPSRRAFHHFEKGIMIKTPLLFQVNEEDYQHLIGAFCRSIIQGTGVIIPWHVCVHAKLENRPLFGCGCLVFLEDRCVTYLRGADLRVGCPDALRPGYPAPSLSKGNHLRVYSNYPSMRLRTRLGWDNPYQSVLWFWQTSFD